MKVPPPIEWHGLAAEKAVDVLGSDLARGLAPGEVVQRRRRHGPNVATSPEGPGEWRRFLRQFAQPLLYVLLGAAGIAAAMGEGLDAAVIVAVALVNGLVGYLQEAKAEAAIRALAKTVIHQATVRRGGASQRIPSSHLVPGDVVLVRSGDLVPADLRFTQTRNLRADESMLTGESLPVAKQAGALPVGTELAERSNLGHAGTLVTSGQGEAVVCRIGDDTEAGQLGRLVAATGEGATPLGHLLGRFSQGVLWVILGLAGLTFGLGVARGEPAAAMFMAAVALAIGAIPEGLPAAVTVVLAMGATRLARRQVVMRRLSAVETLGSTTVICSDKTGTLTKNQMTVQAVRAGGREYVATGLGYGLEGGLWLGGEAVELEAHAALRECLRAGVLCNDAELVWEEGEAAARGDPTEAALLAVAAKAGLSLTGTREEAPRRDVIPFESELMFRATLHGEGGGGVIYVVGALERVLPRCVEELGAAGDAVALEVAAVQRGMDGMARRGLRVVALARRRVDAGLIRLEIGEVAGGLTFLGLVGMMDPPREEAVVSVRKCQAAGIAIKMITGDHVLTARAVAEQLGLQGEREGGRLVALAGRDLELFSEEALPEVADRTAVFARVSPEQKLRLVRALQARGHVVAMTGDGVNDAPALKQADIGIAMGRSGTDAAKGAGDMILSDDNFAGIVAAVESGRGIFDNLTKFLVWIIPTNLGEALMLLSAILLGLPLPLLPLQLLWINLTDTLLGLALAFEPTEGDVMERPPRGRASPLLSAELWWRSGLVALIMVVGGIGIFLWELRLAPEGLVVARTAAINAVVMVQMAYLFNCRSLRRPAWCLGLWSNGWAVLGALAMLGAQLLLTYAPVLNRLFHTAPLSLAAWGRLGAVAGAVFLVVEVEKGLRRRGGWAQRWGCGSA